MTVKRRLITYIFAICLSAGSLFGMRVETMAESFEKTNTWCIGRYLVDLPTNLEPQGGSGSIGTVQIERLGSGDQRALSDLFEQRRRTLAAGTPNADGAIPELVATSGRDGVMSLMWKAGFPNLGYKSADFTEEVYVLSEGEMLRVVGFVEGAFVERDRTHVALVARAVRPRSQGQRFSDVGVCLPDSFVALPIGNEAVSMMFVDPDVGPFALNIAILSRLPGAPALPERQSFSDPDASRVVVANLEGETLRGSNTKVQEFLLRAGGKPKASDVEMDLRVRLTDQRALEGSSMMEPAQFNAIWEQILSSFRMSN